MDPEHDWKVRSSGPDTPGTAPGELTGPACAYGQLAGARAAYAQLESTLGPNHPQSKAQKAQIDELTKEIDAEQNRLMVQAKQAYVVARANEEIRRQRRWKHEKSGRL